MEIPVYNQEDYIQLSWNVLKNGTLSPLEYGTIQIKKQNYIPEVI